MAPSRKRATHTHVEVPLKRSLGTGGTELRAVLVEALVKYLLFVRRQVPKQFDELVSDTRTSATPTAGVVMAARRRERCVEAVHGMLGALRALVAESPPGLVALALGHSPTLPKEVYVLRFASTSPPSLGGPVDRPVAQDCTRRMLRKLVSEVEAEFDGVSRPMKLWLLVHGKAVELPSEDPLQAAFAPRPGFRIPIGKAAHVVTIDIGEEEAFDRQPFGWVGMEQRRVEHSLALAAAPMSDQWLAAPAAAHTALGTNGLDANDHLSIEPAYGSSAQWLLCNRSAAGFRG